MTGGTTQFINQKLIEEGPIFSKTRVDFTPTHPLTHLVVSDSHIVMALANRTLIRINPTGKQEEIDLSKTVAGAKISNLFLDPTGDHLLISVKTSDTDCLPSLYYLHTKWTKPRPCNKFRGCLVSSVGWSQTAGNETTGPLLAGTTMGLIIETELTCDEGFFLEKAVEVHYKQMFDIGKGQHTPVTGLEYHSVPNTEKYFVIATTPTRMYQFQGYVTNKLERPLLQQVFNNYLNVQERFLELISSLKYSTLSFFTPSNNSLPSQFGWLTEQGIYCGRVDPWEGESDSVTLDCQLITTDPTPSTAYVTQFHVLQLYKDRVKGVSQLNQQVVFDDQFDGTYGTLVGLSHDRKRNLYWAYTEYAVYKYKLVNEARHVWRIYLEQDQFSLAMRHCDNQPSALDMILTKQAEHLFKEGKYVESAMHYAKTRCSFEEVSLRFMNLEDKTALKNYLKKKLETLRSSEKTQMTLIVVWLVEIYQNQMGKIREIGDKKADLANLEEEFLSLLRQPRVEECIKNNKETVYSLLGSHGDQRSLVYLAQNLRDTERVVQYNMRNKQYSAVLSLLTQQSDPDLWYTHAPSLLSHSPEQTVNALLSLPSNLLSPVRLLPGLLPSPGEENRVGYSIRYLEYVIGLGCKDEAVHNLLVSLYTTSIKEKVLSYLKGEQLPPQCDLKYALKLCLEAKMNREAVQLYAMLGQHEAAVELGLQIDIDLAANCAAGRLTGVELSEEVSRNLWLKVARHVVMEKNDIKQAMEFLKECPSVKIEDILPFFPDFVTIDHFKSAICESLQQYSDHIQQLKEEMAEASKSAGVIRQEIVEAKSNYQFVGGSDRCSTCSGLLLTRPFYLFSCSHKFHSDCLAESVLPHLAPARQRKLTELQSQLKSQSVVDSVSVDSKSVTPSKQDMTQAELDDLIASECIFCGDIMIRNIDKPFIEDHEFDDVIKEWL